MLTIKIDLPDPVTSAWNWILRIKIWHMQSTDNNSTDIIKLFCYNVLKFSLRNDSGLCKYVSKTINCTADIREDWNLHNQSYTISTQPTGHHITQKQIIIFTKPVSVLINTQKQIILIQQAEGNRWQLSWLNYLIHIMSRPRMRRASCMSFGIMVTRLAWMAQRLASSNR